MHGEPYGRKRGRTARPPEDCMHAGAGPPYHSIGSMGVGHLCACGWVEGDALSTYPPEERPPPPSRPPPGNY